jgi:hypothetical protein
MAARIDNARLALFFANKQNNHNHLQDHKRPMLNSLVQVTEEITLKPGVQYYFPGVWCNAETKYQKDTTVVRIPNDTSKPVFSGGVKTN